jgi:hypothetical protein
MKIDDLHMFFDKMFRSSIVCYVIHDLPGMTTMTTINQPVLAGFLSNFLGENTLVVLAGLVRGKSKQETMVYICLY